MTSLRACSLIALTALLVVASCGDNKPAFDGVAAPDAHPADGPADSASVCGSTCAVECAGAHEVARNGPRAEANVIRGYLLGCLTASPTPTITPDGPTTFCSGGSVTLTSSDPTGNQWFLNGNPIGGATDQQYIATASGDYTVAVTVSGCITGTSAPTTVTTNPNPESPTITPGGPTTFCAGGSVTMTSSSASGNQWYLDGNPIGGATNQSYVATASGGYTVNVTAGGCTGAPSPATTVTVNPTPATTTVTPDGPTTFCDGGSVGLMSSNATGNQWFLNGNPIGGATSQTYVATASGNYTVAATFNGCTGGTSNPSTVTSNQTPATPTITAAATTLCNGGTDVLLMSSSASSQWYLDGNPISGATNQQYLATAPGDYSVTVTSNGCASAASAATTVNDCTQCLP